MDVETEQIVSNIRACAISTKGGIPLPCLDRDYRVLVGHSIPYRKLGFDTLEQFLRSIPNVSISKRGGETVLDAMPSKNTEHLASLVARQKSASKKVKPPIRMGQRRTAAMQWQPPPMRAMPRPVRRSPVSPGPRGPGTLPQTKASKPTRQERPPRFHKMPSREALPNNSESAREPQLRRLPTMSNPPLNESSYSSVPSPHGDGIQSIDELEAQVKQLALNSNPTSALQARLQKLQKPSVFPLADNLVADLSKNTELPDFEKQLRQLTVEQGLGIPLYTAVPRFPKGEPVVYNCKVKVGEETYTSYPDEDRAPAVALQRAARNALRVLQKRYSTRDRNCPVTASPELVTKRVTEMVASHESGVWSFQVPPDYKDQYQETLPQDWLEIVRGYPRISMETIGNNRVILTLNVVSSTPTIDSTAGNLDLQQTQRIVPDPIIYPTGDVWDVYVTCAISTTEVWIRLIGKEYNERYEAMSTKMEMHYMENAVLAVNPEVGHYYAIKLDDCWHRVELLEAQTNGDGVVFFMDHGDEEIFPLTKLHVLEPKFASLPAQAIQVVLSGLEKYANDLNATEHLVNTVIGKTLVAQIVSRPTSDDPESTISVLLYDTSTDEDVDVNSLLTEHISDAPHLPENGVVTEVFVSYVNEEGEVYLNIRSERFSDLKSLMEKLMEDGISETLIAKSANHASDPTKLYLARYSVDYEYYRASIISEPGDKNWVTVRFVDYGNIETVSTSNLFLLGQLSETLERFPFQAIKVLLHSVPQEAFGARFVERFRELVKEDDPVLVKVMKSGIENAPPEVEMFKRAEDKQFISINNTLALDPELVKPKQAAENRARRRHGSRTHPVDIIQGEQHKCMGVSQVPDVGNNQRGLGVPQIPDVGQYFDVHVTMAANPCNFTVQPYKERAHLEDLMSKMQEYYNSHTLTPVSSENVKEGNLFAALHSDSHWYRVNVSNVIGGNTVSVYFCDFGDVAFLALEKLQPLSNQFKTLPAQAIKAKLARIMPIHGDWSVEDCIRFQERVVEKQFVSVIVDSGPDLLNPSDIVIGLQLYDTSGITDIEIDSLLVDEKRAVFTPSVLQQLQQVQQLGLKEI